MSVGRMYHLSWILSGVGFLGLTVLGGALGSVPIFLFGLVLAVCAFVYAMYLSIVVIRNGDRRLLKHGIRGKAKVLKAHETNTVMQEGEFAWNAPYMWKYTLQVTLPAKEPYETNCNICALLNVGDEVDVAAAPHNHKRVTIDVGQAKGGLARSAQDNQFR
jgi:hypothetical protein